MSSIMSTESEVRELLTSLMGREPASILEDHRSFYCSGCLLVLDPSLTSADDEMFFDLVEYFLGILGSFGELDLFIVRFSVSLLPTELEKGGEYRRGGVHCRIVHGPFRVYMIDVRVNRDEESEWIDSLAHELVHAHQWCTEKLTVDSEGHRCWQGVRVPASIPYFDRPWEKDARERARNLVAEARTRCWTYPQREKSFNSTEASGAGMCSN